VFLIAGAALAGFVIGFLLGWLTDWSHDSWYE